MTDEPTNPDGDVVPMVAVDDPFVAADEPMVPPTPKPAAPPRRTRAGRARAETVTNLGFPHQPGAPAR